MRRFYWAKGFEQRYGPIDQFFFIQILSWLHLRFSFSHNCIGVPIQMDN